MVTTPMQQQQDSQWAETQVVEDHGMNLCQEQEPEPGATVQ